jgi:hypothetical protein
MRLCEWQSGDDPDKKARTKPERRRFHVKHLTLGRTGRAVEEERWRPLDLDPNQTAVREDTLAPRLLGQPMAHAMGALGRVFLKGLETRTTPVHVWSHLLDALCLNESRVPHG